MSSSSPNTTIFSDDQTQANNDDVAILTRQTLNPYARFFFPHNYFSPPPPPPPIYFFSGTYLPPPPTSYWVYYPCWFINPNPNRFEHAQEPPLYSPNPNEEVLHPPTSSTRVLSRRNHRGGKKMMWRRMIKNEVESSEDHITTVMLRNIPNRFTREIMIEFMDKHCEEMNKNDKDEDIPISAYDFLYLPIDFMTEMNKGYAFVNFTNAKAVSMFKGACDNKPWGSFPSNKVLQITSARIQGKEELVKHFQHMNYPDEAYTPVCFSPARSGSKNPVQITLVGKWN